MNPTKIVIVGAGFGGLAAAKALKKTPAEITLIDRTNHHLFQPLLYQVATSESSRPRQIGWPIRQHSSQSEEHHSDPGRSHGCGERTEARGGEQRGPRRECPFAYDYLIRGHRALPHSYFGHNEFAKICAGAEEPGRCRGSPKQDLAGVRTS